MKEIIVDDKKVVQYKRRSWLSFVVFFAMNGLAYSAWKWLSDQPNNANGTKTLLRKGMETNESIFSHLFNEDKLAKEYPTAEAAKKPRVNGNLGLNSTFDAAQWKLNVVKATGDILVISLDEIKKLPKVQVVFDFKCIEGWDQVTSWGGIRFSDFIRHFNLTKQQAMQYVGMVTPDEKYYVGIDMPSMLQPQTILCYEMNGKPLPIDQGYPLRLIIPVKYGVKHIKRISTITFADTKPKDYWAENGYDYYTGH